MKKVVLLQKYISPYRIPLFNGLAEHPEIDFTLVHYGNLEKRRKWTKYPTKKFSEFQTKRISIKLNYTQNINLPLSLISDFARLRPEVIICAPDTGGVSAYLYTRKTPGSSYIIWSEATHITEQVRKIGFLKKCLRSVIYRGSSRFIVPGQMAADYIREYVPSAKIFYANNCLNEDDFKISEDYLRQKWAKRRLTLTFSGSLIKDKGITFLLEAFKGLMKEKPYLKENCLLRILGTGPLDLSAYQDENILFEGFCEGEKYYNFMKESHVFILPSLRDCNPLTVIEALFAGNILIVSSRVGNYPEAVRDNGLIIQSISEAEIGRAIDSILALPRERLVDMALNSLAVSSTFTVEKSLEGFISAIFNNEREASSPKRVSSADELCSPCAW